MSGPRGPTAIPRVYERVAACFLCARRVATTGERRGAGGGGRGARRHLAEQFKEIGASTSVVLSFAAVKRLSLL